MEAINLSVRGFRAMITGILNSMKKDRNHKKGPIRNKNAISEINNTL